MLSRLVVVVVAQQTILDIHDLLNGNVGQDIRNVQDIVQTGRGRRRRVDALGRQVRRVERGARHVVHAAVGVGRLPLPPDAVDVVVVQEEDGVAGGGVLVAHL